MASWMDDLIAEALEALRRREFDQAVRFADQVLAEDPDHAEARLVRARGLLGLGTGLEAFHEARRAVACAPENPRAHNLLGLAAWRTERLSLAQEHLEKAVELSARRPGMLVDYAWFMANARGPRLALEAARQAIEADPESSTAWAALGLAQLRHHERSEAEQSLVRALKLDPTDPYAQEVMARLLQEQRQDTKAVALASVLQDTPGTEEIVESIRREAKKRQVARLMVERRADPDARRRERSSPVWVWVAAFATVVAVLVLVSPPVSVFNVIPYAIVIVLMAALLLRGRS